MCSCSVRATLCVESSCVLLSVAILVNRMRLSYSIGEVLAYCLHCLLDYHPVLMKLGSWQEAGMQK